MSEQRRPPQTCAQCKVVFMNPRERKYCSTECTHKAREVDVTLTCDCGVVFKRTPAQIRKSERAFCSKHCARMASFERQMVRGYEVRGNTAGSLARNVQIVEMALAGATNPQIAARVGIGRNIVVSTLSRAGLLKGRRHVGTIWSADEDEIIVRNQGTTAGNMSAMLPGRSIEAIQARRKKLSDLGLVAARTRKNTNRGNVQKRRPMPSLVVGAFEPTEPKPPTITCETVVPTSYDLPDPRHQCTYLYGRALPYRQCQAVAERGAWCAGHYAAVYRPDTAYERAA